MMRRTERWIGMISFLLGWALAFNISMVQAGTKVNVSVGGNVNLFADSDEGLIVYDQDGRAPGDNYVRVEAPLLGADIALPVFWRVKFRAGFNWVDGRWDNNIYVPGYWRPGRSRGADWAWVAGHWVGRKWIAGRWRSHHRDGYIWIEGHWNQDGEWIEGYWNPVEARADNEVWEPGCWGLRGEWVEGFWRPRFRNGFIWISGDYNDQSVWIRGRWQKARPDEVWVRGYWDHQGRWYPGKVTKNPGRNQRYSPGHYNHQGKWMAPRWEDEKNWRRERERQNNNYRQDREGHRENPQTIPQHKQLENYRQDREESSRPAQPQGGAVRKIGGGGSEYQGHEDRRDYRLEDKGGSQKREYESAPVHSNQGLHKGQIRKIQEDNFSEPPQAAPPAQRVEQHQPPQESKDKGKSEEGKDIQKENYRKMR